jgi:pilus assembly protein CpaC
MMKRRWLVATLALSLVPSLALAQRRDRDPPNTSPATPTKTTTIELSMIVGENKTIPAEDVSSYSVGAPGIVDVKVTPKLDQFVIVGLRPGNTTVLMLKKSGVEVTYNINVFTRAPASVEKEVGELLAGYTGLKLRQVGSRFFIEGGVATEADAKRVSLIAALYPGQVESLVVVGSVGSEHTINVRIDFYFIQYNKTTNYGVGIAWPSAIGANSQFSFTHDFIGNNTTATGTATQVLPALDLAQTRGWAKVLKHTTVITTSGSEAVFTNGGEQNFAVATGITSSIQPIKFGTNMTVLPRYDSVTKALEVKVNANVSDLTPPAGAATLPGRQTADVNTFVHLKLGESLVISGIRSSSQTHSVTGLPLLSQIPVLGLFFGSHTNSTDDIEGAVFIIPSIVESVPRKAYNIIDAAMKEYEDYSGDIENKQSYTHAPPSYR